MAGCDVLYDSMYRICSQTIHTSPRCLQEYVREAEDGYIEAIIHGPDPDGTNQLLYDMAVFLVILLRGACDVFEIRDRGNLDAFEAALNAATET